MNRRTFLATGTGAVLASAGAAQAASAPDYQSAGAVLATGRPTSEGFHFPAEWQRHEQTLMQFPPPQNWYPRQLAKARRDWALVANTIAEFEPVTMALRNADRKSAGKLLSSAIELIDMPLNDAWSRDSGPMIVANGKGQRAVAGFTFNGWGGKFPPYRDDALAKARFAAHLDMPIYTSELVSEGGALAMDGQGTLITTEECLMNRNRNPGWSKAQIEAQLKDFLGVTKIIWLPKGLTPDPITDGHVDGLATFAALGVVLLHKGDDSNDPNTTITRNAKRILQAATDAQGRRLEVIDVPLTSWDVVHMNFYICNGAVVVPIAGKTREDDAPLAILREVFPHHKVIGLTGNMLASGGGGVHCITQQVPLA